MSDHIERSHNMMGNDGKDTLAQIVAELRGMYKHHPDQSGSCLADWADRLERLSARSEVIIRNNDDGSLDEICTDSFHLEQMSGTHWWMSVVPGLHVNMTSRSKIKASICDERPPAQEHPWEAVGTVNPPFPETPPSQR